LATVPAPQATIPPHSLIRSAITNRDSDPDWQRGLEYAPETVGGYRALSGCTAEVVDFGAGGPPVAAVDYTPWELQVEDPCASVFGYREDEVTDRLRRAMDSTESYAIARELWAGDLTKADTAAAGDGAAPNLYLARDPEVLNGGTPVSPKRGLGMLEKAVGDALRGQQAFLHISRTARPFFPELVKVGNLLYTNIDNVVVADAGYPGTPPDGTPPDGTDDADGVAWVYATGPVVVRRSPFAMDSASAAEVVDTRTNAILRTASKRVAATFDPATLFAVPITLS
jgi:hypothetical protein